MQFVTEWDRQQTSYIAAREERFDTMLMAIEWSLAERGVAAPLVVDLGCGPGALGQRLLRRFPDARYVGIDIDPVLLHLARQVAAERATGRFTVIDCDVADERWLDLVPVGEVDAVCSSTALHWLDGDALDRTVAIAHRALADGGVLLNADHLGSGSRFDDVARWVADRDERAARQTGALDWPTWWGVARADPELGPLCLDRDRVYPPAVDETGDDDADGESGRPLLRSFLDALIAAGFDDVDTIWQRFDDRIVMGLKRSPAPR